MGFSFKKVNKENFSEILEKHPLAVIEFRTIVCSPCTTMEGDKLESVAEKLKEEYKDKVFFGKVLIDKNPEMAQKFDVKSSMTFLFFRKGKLVDRISVFKEGVLEKEVKKHIP